MLADSLLAHHDLIRRLAEVADAVSSARFELPTLWQALRRGEVEVALGFCSPERAFLVLRRTSGVRRPKLGRLPIADDLDALERVLRGVPQKVVAFDRRRSLSTTAVHFGRALRTLGIRGTVSRAPLLLMLAAQAAATGKNFGARSSRFTCADEAFEVVSALRPETCLQRHLTQSEYLVASLFLEGSSYHEMSHSRGRSPRTIANQLVSIFKKLGVSGRSGLLSRAVRHSARSEGSSEAAERIAAR